MPVINKLPTHGGSVTELAHFTGADQTRTLPEDVHKFKYILAVSYYNNFILNSVEIPPVLWIDGQQFIINFNDNTIRKAQMVMVDSTHARSSNVNWLNITGVYLYGVK